MTPAEALLGFNLDIQSNIDDLTKSITYDVAECVEDLHVMQDLLSSHLHEAKDAMKQQYDKRHLSHTYHIGDWVMSHTKTLIQEDQPRKLITSKSVLSNYLHVWEIKHIHFNFLPNGNKFTQHTMFLSLNHGKAPMCHTDNQVLSMITMTTPWKKYLHTKICGIIEST